MQKILFSNDSKKIRSSWCTWTIHIHGFAYLVPISRNHYENNRSSGKKPQFQAPRISCAGKSFSLSLARRGLRTPRLRSRRRLLHTTLSDEKERSYSRNKSLAP